MERAGLDFANLPFAYQKTDANIRYWFRDGKWSAGELTADEHIPIHIAATCLHYGQEVFEGLKVYERPDGRIQTFRSIENAHRMQRSAQKLFMQPVPDALFREAVHKVVRANRRFVPPYGSGASLYVRPLLLGVSANINQALDFDTASLVAADFEFEPNAAELLGRLLPRYVDTTVFLSLVESQASEHGARMSAKSAATKNAGDQKQDRILGHQADTDGRSDGQPPARVLRIQQANREVCNQHPP